MKVNVYLSYYNGSKYIDAQIESLLDQKNVDVHIYIRDDGSKKQESAYLDKFKENNQITIIHADNIGYGKSFMWLVSNIKDKADFYAFCDQDDVWLDFKLETACRKLITFTEPAAYSALPKYVDRNLKPLDGFHSFTDDLHFGKMNIEDALAYQIFGLGCTYVWNNALNEIIKKIDIKQYSFPHDNFLSILTPFVGTFYRDNLHPILYRQHGKNVGGNKNTSQSILKKIKSKIRNFNNQTDFLMRKYIVDNMYDVIPLHILNVLKTSVFYRKRISEKLKLLKYVYYSKIDSKKKIKNLTMILGNKY